MDNKNIETLLQDILPADRIKCKLIDLVASASDAGFYYLKPIAVVLPISEQEVAKLFAFSQKHRIPLVFRTAGTSLSGQSITDGILVDLSIHWRNLQIEDNGKRIRVQPGVVGSTANSYLADYGRKIGPDPASIASAMVGGIISNNSSGMCCGVSKNVYHTLHSVNFLLPNGKAYSTGRDDNHERFLNECPEIYNGLMELRREIFSRPEILEKIRKKYLTKNTVGYGLNAFLDYIKPLDILGHLLIGAEGTLGFIAEAVLNTVSDYKHKATALLYFSDIITACSAIESLKKSGAAAIELMDRAALRSIENIPGIPEKIAGLPESAAVLLIEYQQDSELSLADRVTDFRKTELNLNTLYPAVFTSLKNEQALLWKVRKGMFPSVGAIRARGTSVILEDVAFPVQQLGSAVYDLQNLFKKHAYHDAIIFGHAIDGNIHFVISQAFDEQSQIDRYDAFIKDVVELVVGKYEGALKAEHGTGRNMAPFVEVEWGGEIYSIMKAVKELIDPLNLLNPGVIINTDPSAHLTDLKKLKQVEEEIDKCMECGFCEQACPSRDLTLTPRKRIVVRRELLKLKDEGRKKEYKELLGQYQYNGLDTCAVDGLCASVCPVEINTGDLVKRLRRESHSQFANKSALIVAKNFKTVAASVKFGLSSGFFINKTLGSGSMRKTTTWIRKLIPSFPLWSPNLGAAGNVNRLKPPIEGAFTVVYFPTCISRLIGPADPGAKDQIQTFLDIAEKARLNVILPSGINKVCCGQIFSSKGFSDAYSYSANKSIELLWEASFHGMYPIVVDISSCTQTILGCKPVLSELNKKKFDSLRFLDTIDFLHDLVLPRIRLSSKKENIVLHPVCSLKKMSGTEVKLTALAEHFANLVTVPAFAGCCGMAGDRGFLYPELTASAIAAEAREVKNGTFDGCYSTSKTCEIALSDATGLDYQSILTLVDECTAPV